MMIWEEERVSRMQPERPQAYATMRLEMWTGYAIPMEAAQYTPMKREADSEVCFIRTDQVKNTVMTQREI